MPHVLDKIKETDKYFGDHGKRLPADVIVYRGQSILTNEIEGLLAGKEYVLHGYVSTSTMLTTGNSFMQNGESGVKSFEPKHFLQEDTLLKKATKIEDFDGLGREHGDDPKIKKFKCLLVITGLENTLSVVPGSWGGHRSECEIVLNRGTRLALDKSSAIRIIGGNNSQSLLIFCKVTSDGDIPYVLNEGAIMVQEAVQEKKTFSQKLNSKKTSEDVEKELIVAKLVEEKKPSNKKDDTGVWTDDVFG